MLVTTDKAAVLVEGLLKLQLYKLIVPSESVLLLPLGLTVLHTSTFEGAVITAVGGLFPLMVLVAKLLVLGVVEVSVTVSLTV